jgi:hypothetical protein
MLVGYIDPRSPRLAPMPHERPSYDPGELAPGDTRGDTNVSRPGVRWGPLGFERPERFRENPLEQRGKRPTRRMPEEGLEPPTRGL